MTGIAKKRVHITTLQYTGVYESVRLKFKKIYCLIYNDMTEKIGYFYKNKIKSCKMYRNTLCYK